MRKLLVILFCFCSCNVFADTASKAVIKIQHWKTSTGAKVYFVEVPNLPILDVRVLFAAGSIYDDKKQGIAAFTNNMIGEGTTKQNANQIAEAFDKVGAQFNVAADRDKAMVSLRSLTELKYLDPAITEFTEVLTQMSFDAKALQRVKNQTIAAIKVEAQEPGDVAERVFYKTIYGTQPYAHDPLGTVFSVKSITPAEVNHFYRRYYVAKNADIVLVGALTKEQAKETAEKIANALPEGNAAPPLKESTSSKHRIGRHIPFPAKQTAIMMGQVGINRKNPDYFPLIVGSYVFGGLPLGSILFQEVRNKKGLAYYVGSDFRPLRYRGPFLIQLKTRANKTKEALTVVENALSSFLKNGPTEEQLNVAKQNLIGRFPFSISNNANIAAVVSAIAFYQRPLNYLDTYISNVRAVTPEKVKTAFEKTIDPLHFAIVTVGPVVQK